MINTYRETLPNGTLLEIPYDTDKITGICSDCNKEIYGDLVKNYEARGNYCTPCNSKYTQKYSELELALK